jgi:hypothetical protein
MELRITFLFLEGQGDCHFGIFHAVSAVQLRKIIRIDRAAGGIGELQPRAISAQACRDRNLFLIL